MKDRFQMKGRKTKDSSSFLVFSPGVSQEPMGNDDLVPSRLLQKCSSCCRVSGDGLAASRGLCCVDTFFKLQVQSFFGGIGCWIGPLCKHKAAVQSWSEVLKKLAILWVCWNPQCSGDSKTGLRWALACTHIHEKSAFFI